MNYHSKSRTGSVAANSRVTIGLPVFNGEKYLREALDSILYQTYRDFELLISDNASTDHTPQICLEYASKDSRIQYFRNAKNIGAPQNFNRVFELSHGAFFKWATYDDIYSPTYLQKCINVLDSDPSVMVCHSKTGRIDEKGKWIGNYDWVGVSRMDSEKPHERFVEFLSISNPVWAIYGLMRANFLKMTPLYRCFVGSDRNLIAEISLRGKIHEIPEYLFFGREHPSSYTGEYYEEKSITTKQRYLQQLAWWGQNDWLTFPNIKNCFEYFRSARRVKTSWSEKLLCYDQIFRWFLKEGCLLIEADFGNLIMLQSPKAYQLIKSVKSKLKHISLLTAKKTIALERT